MNTYGSTRGTQVLLGAIEMVRTRTSKQLAVYPIAGIALVAALDWATGPNVNLSLGYAVVTMFAAFALSLRAGYALSIAVAAWSWCLGYWHPSASLGASTVVLNSGLRLVFFCLLSVGAATLRSAVDELERVAGTDVLTGAWNRRSLVTLLQREIARAERNSHPLSIAYLDLTKLKQTNDTFGHIAGDRLICSLTDGLKNGVRRGDIVARVGGDEFVVVLPDVDASTAAELLSRIFATPDIPEANAGIVQLEPSKTELTVDAEELIRSADVAMYHAKKNGLPLYCSSSQPPAAQPS